MKQLDIGRVLGAAISTIYTGLIYISNTPTGTKAQADFVAYYTLFAFVMGLLICFMTDDSVLARKARTEEARIWSAIMTTNAVAQILLLAVTAHFFLLLMRLLAFVFVRGRIKLAEDRREQVRDRKRAT